MSAMPKVKPEPTEDVLDKVEEIGNIRRDLSLAKRSMVSANQKLYVQSGNLPGGGVQYMAGGRKLFAGLVFERRPDGTRGVRKYRPGAWESRVDSTLSLCRTLYRIDQMPDWPAEKAERYFGEQVVDQGLLDKTQATVAEYSEVMSALLSDRSSGNRMELFLDELDREWPLEYLELTLAVPSHTSGVLKTQVVESVELAHMLGLMLQKHWVSWEELRNMCLCAGFNLVSGTRSALGQASQCRATGFAEALVAVANVGTARALDAGWRDGDGG